MEPFIAEIRILPYTFAPKDWAWCNGQIMPISQNTALFSLLGAVYGGDGKIMFGLPNLQGRAPMHPGENIGITPRTLGETGGEPAVTLLPTQIPPHTHAVNADATSATVSAPGGAFLAQGRASVGTGPQRNKPLYSAGPANTMLSYEALGMTGGNQPHENRQPFLGVNFCIALQGLFPSRN